MTRPLARTAIIDIGIDRADREPIQSQIVKQVRGLVLTGRLRPRSRLPSTRALAGDLAVARATVVEAYEQLLSEGYIETRSGSGTRIAVELPEVLLTPAATGLESPHTRSEAKREPARPFRSGLVDWEHFPHDDWGKLLGRFWRNPPISLLEHSDAFGWLPLRQAIARHIFEWRGIACAAEQVIVTAGGTDAFYLIARALLCAGDRIWIEEPGYPTARRVFSLGGVRVVPVPIDGDGLMVSAGRDLAGKARAAFVTPARQYPTGATMPLARRLELLDWAREVGAVVIEDDYDSEYRYVGRPLPALMSLDGRAPVIYSGSFSKVFSPILRLGFIVVPAAMIERFREQRGIVGGPPSLLAQPALAEFMASGAFAIHIRRMRRIYASRRAILLEALKPGDGRYFTIDAAPSGLMLLLRLRPDLNDEPIAGRLARRGIEVLALSGHYAGRRREPGLLLGFAGFAEKELRRAAQILIDGLKR